MPARSSLAALALVACGTRSTVAPRAGTAAVVSPPGTPTAVTPDAGVAPRPQVARSVHPALESPHGGAIVELGVTADGGAAISCDELGGIRLWPVLDGSVEPRVVELPHPRALALGRDPQGFVVAAIDDVGGLVIEIVDANGNVVQGVTSAPEPAFVGVAMTDRGPLAWRADQTVVQLDREGAVTSRLVVEPGQHVIALAVNGSHAVAAIESGAGPSYRARWLTLGARLAWGAWIPAAASVTPPIALSPSGSRLASVVRLTESTAQALVFDTATGTLLAREAADDASDIAFADDDHVATSTSAGVTWVPILTPAPPPGAPAAKPTLPPPTGEHGLLGAGGGYAISAVAGDLVVATPAATNFLGYALEAPAVAAAASHGRVLIGIGNLFWFLDAGLRATAALKLGVPDGAAVAAVHWLAGDDWLVEWSRIEDGITALALVDAARTRVQVQKTAGATVQLIAYEPRTHLLALWIGTRAELDRYDPAKHELTTVSSLPEPKDYERVEVFPVAPELADGARVVIVHHRDQPSIRWAPDPHDLDNGRTITIAGAVAKVDPAGRVFVWRNTADGALDLVYWTARGLVGPLPNNGPAALIPDPSATDLVEIGQQTVALYTVAGARVWTQPLQVTDALWLDDGSLVVVSVAGLARLDRQTGAVTAARCGWGFGLTAKPHPVPARVEPICAQAARP